jgi:hypothetical protein
MLAAISAASTAILSLSLLSTGVTAMLQCPEDPGWQVIDESGGSGGRWKIPGDFTFIKTPLKKADGSLNGTWTHVAVNFTLTSAFDHLTLPCSGETITATPGNLTDSNPGQGYINGTCAYPKNAIMGEVETNWSYNLNYKQAEFYAYQDFSCNRTAHGRP